MYQTFGTASESVSKTTVTGKTDLKGLGVIQMNQSQQLKKFVGLHIVLYSAQTTVPTKSA